MDHKILHEPLSSLDLQRFDMIRGYLLQTSNHVIFIPNADIDSVLLYILTVKEYTCLIASEILFFLTFVNL